MILQDLKSCRKKLQKKSARGMILFD